MIRRGSLAGTVLVSSTDASGNIARLRITGPGVVVDEGQLELGSGALNIPGPIAVTP